MVTRLAFGTVILAMLLQATPAPVLIIAHRGASGHRPEHTIEAYTLAIEMGADYIEPDLVSTKDGVLVARHENEIGGTTDVEAKFPARRTTKSIDGVAVTGWFTEDFTLAELQTLRARERLPFRSHAYDGQFALPTFDAVVRLAQDKGRQVGRNIGVYPETKHPSYFRQIGLPLEPRIVEVLARHRLSARSAAVFVQSFEESSLRLLRGLTEVRLIQLLDQGATVSPERLGQIATYADGIGVNTRLVLPVGTDRRLGPPTSLVRDAHRAGLLVHTWTLRNEPAFLSPTYEGNALEEYRELAALGVDGVFSDFPDTAVRALRPQQ